MLTHIISGVAVFVWLMPPLPSSSFFSPSRVRGRAQKHYFRACRTLEATSGDTHFMLFYLIVDVHMKWLHCCSPLSWYYLGEWHSLPEVFGGTAFSMFRLTAPLHTTIHCIQR